MDAALRSFPRRRKLVCMVDSKKSDLEMLRSSHVFAATFPNASIARINASTNV